MLWLFEPRWWITSTVLMALAGAYGVYHGYQWADRSAEIAALKSDVAAHAATIAALRKRAASDAAAVNAYSQREQLANEALTDMQEAIDALDASKAALPAADVCRLAGDDLRVLRDLATRAAGDHPGTPARP
jgi:ATPase subunit of ABC transporter with duplicated ATPase domains